MIDVEFNDAGRFKRARTTLTVDAPPDVVWATLLDFNAYPSFMPRVDEANPRKREGRLLVDFELDTPLVSTSYTSRYQLLPNEKKMHVVVVDGDIEDSEFHWSLAPVAGGTRITYDLTMVPSFYVPGFVIKAQAKKGVLEALQGIEKTFGGA